MARLHFLMRESQPVKLVVSLSRAGSVFYGRVLFRVVLMVGDPVASKCGF